jgi:hypothetical protein
LAKERLEEALFDLEKREDEILQWKSGLGGRITEVNYN